MAKRKPQSRESLARRAPVKDPYDKVLIICTGKTEKIYFNDLKRKLRLSSANIIILQKNADPLAALSIAKDESTQLEANENEYDSMWCVFDKDRFPQFNQALANARSMNISLAWSVPCFEYWLLLHFVETASPYRESGGKTGAQLCVQHLKRVASESGYKYTKPGNNSFRATWSNVTLAMIRAKKRLTDARSIQELNPSTQVHKLVKYLMRLKK